MGIDASTQMNYFVPALLFPAIPLMMINFGNRYAIMAALIRNLHDEYLRNPDPETGGARRYIGQITTLRSRLRLIGIIQTASGIAFLLNLGVMMAVYFRYPVVALVIFGLVLGLMMLAMLLFIVEVQVANRALDLHLSDLEMFGEAKLSRRRQKRQARRDEKSASS